jgi:hypothetical protein
MRKVEGRWCWCIACFGGTAEGDVCSSLQRGLMHLYTCSCWLPEWIVVSISVPSSSFLQWSDPSRAKDVLES